MCLQQKGNREKYSRKAVRAPCCVRAGARLVSSQGGKGVGYRGRTPGWGGGASTTTDDDAVLATLLAESIAAKKRFGKT